MTQKILTASERLRQQMLGGKVATAGAPVSLAPPQANEDAQSADSGLDALADKLLSLPAARSLVPPRPGVFTELSGAASRTIQDPAVALDLRLDSPKFWVGSGAAAQRDEPVEPAQADEVDEAVSDRRVAVPQMSASDRLRQTTVSAATTSHARREMATMKALTRMLESVYARPGSTASEQARMAALSDLSVNARELGAVVARLAGDDVDRSNYVAAMATDAAVGLVCHSWEAGKEVDWPRLLKACVSSEDIVSTAQSMAYAQGLQYTPVDGPEAAFDRLAISTHSAFWRLIDLGQTVDGMVPKLAAQIVQDSVLYLQARDKFVTDTTLHVSWMQSSLGRMTNLICAELRARFGDRGVVPSKVEIDTALAVARSGFEGVENYAQSIIEKSRPVNADRPSH